MSTFIEEDVNKYYVDWANGDDSSGDGSEGSPWKTITKMVEVINGTASSGLDGDMFIIKNTGVYAEAAQIDVQFLGQDMIITGANANGEIDGTQIVVSGENLNSSTPMFQYNDASGRSDGGVWANIHFDAKDTAQHCIEATTNNNHGVSFINCRFSNATDAGMKPNSSIYWSFIKCRFDNNAGSGFLQASGSLFSLLYKCIFDNNGDDGCRTGGWGRIVECVFHNNEDRGLQAGHGGSVVVGCVFDYNREDGVYISGSGTSLYSDNIFSNNIQNGVQAGSNTESHHFNSLFYNNNIDFNDLTGSNSHMKYFNYVPGASGVNPNYPGGTAPDFDFTMGATLAAAYDAGFPLPYKLHGSTSDSPGLMKYVNTESITII